MSCWPFRQLTRRWHAFNVWRAMRKYARFQQMAKEAEALKHEADELIRRHAEDPQARLPLGDD